MNAARAALTNAVNRAIASGAPVIVERPTRTVLRQAAIHQVNAADYASAASYFGGGANFDYYQWTWAAYRAAHAALLARSLLGLTDADQLYA